MYDALFYMEYYPTAPPMPRTSYKAVFIREIDELLTSAYIFELLFDHEIGLIPFEPVEFCEQIYPIVAEGFSRAAYRTSAVGAYPQLKDLGAYRRCTFCQTQLYSVYTENLVVLAICLFIYYLALAIVLYQFDTVQIEYTHSL